MKILNHSTTGSKKYELAKNISYEEIKKAFIYSITQTLEIDAIIYDNLPEEIQDLFQESKEAK